MFNSGTQLSRKRTLPPVQAPFCRKDPLSSLTDTTWLRPAGSAYPSKNQQLKGEAGGGEVADALFWAQSGKGWFDGNHLAT